MKYVKEVKVCNGVIKYTLTSKRYKGTRQYGIIVEDREYRQTIDMLDDDLDGVKGLIDTLAEYEIRPYDMQKYCEDYIFRKTFVKYLEE